MDEAKFSSLYQKERDEAAQIAKLKLEGEQKTAKLGIQDARLGDLSHLRDKAVAMGDKDNMGHLAAEMREQSAVFQKTLERTIDKRFEEMMGRSSGPRR